jgi:hypothetical protein
MRTLLFVSTIALLFACSPKEDLRDCCAKIEPPHPAPAEPAIAPGVNALAGVDPQVAAACSAGLVTRGLEENEHWLIMHEPAGICPNMGVTEARIREIIAKDWNEAGCTQFTREQMLNALNTGACGGDAG